MKGALTFRTSTGTCAGGGRAAFGGIVTEMAGVESVARSWEAVACCCASRRSCSWACSRISCCRSNTRDDMAEDRYLDLGMELKSKGHGLQETTFPVVGGCAITQRMTPFLDECFYVKCK